MDLTANVRTWEVRSMSGKDTIYIVRRNRAGEFSCSCPHWWYRLAPLGTVCKHVAFVIAHEPIQRPAQEDQEWKPVETCPVGCGTAPAPEYARPAARPAGDGAGGRGLG